MKLFIAVMLCTFSMVYSNADVIKPEIVEIEADQLLMDAKIKDSVQVDQTLVTTSIGGELINKSSGDSISLICESGVDELGNCSKLVYMLTQKSSGKKFIISEAPVTKEAHSCMKSAGYSFVGRMMNNYVHWYLAATGLFFKKSLNEDDDISTGKSKLLFVGGFLIGLPVDLIKFPVVFVGSAIDYVFINQIKKLQLKKSLGFTFDKKNSGKQKNISNKHFKTIFHLANMYEGLDGNNECVFAYDSLDSQSKKTSRRQMLEHHREIDEPANKLKEINKN